jgi:predicted N-acyltransferase
VQLQVLDSIGAVSATEWNALDHAGQPFLRHEFLAALEDSGCVAPETGWTPRHVVARDAAGRLVGALPLYRKTDSWGEFVFDFAWADAYRRAGLRYFPKLVAAVPFTPVTGPRLLVIPGADQPAVATALFDAALEHMRDTGASSLHLLFPGLDEATSLGRRGLLLRKDCQFHWHNRGYASFEDFLGQFTAEKRKKARRERRRVAEAGIRFRILDGDEIDDALWGAIMPLYASTFWRRGREPYLNEDFFRRVARAMPGQMLVVLAMLHAAPVAVAILFRSADSLYGRYWGSSGDYHSLHFETCYHQGIEYCIAHGLQRFEPGTQGEHKIARGFEPEAVWSAHWLSDPRFAAAIDRHLDREREQVDQYIDVVQDHVPFRKEPP